MPLTKTRTNASANSLGLFRFQQNYWQTIELDGVSAYWKFDETSGTTATGYGPLAINATYNNTPNLNQTGPGAVNIPKSVEFRAAQSENAVTAETANFNVAVNGTWSLELWVKYSNAGSTIMTAYAMRDDTGSNNDTLGIITLNNGLAGRIQLLTIDTSGNNLILNSDGGWNNDAWHYVVATATGSGGAVRLYVDNVERASSTTARSTQTPNRAAYIASNISNIQYADAFIAAPAFYSGTALTTGQIQQHWDLGRT